MTQYDRKIWRKFLEDFSVSQSDGNARAMLCRNLWPAECAQTLKTANEVLHNTFLFQLPWDMEQTFEPVYFEKDIDWRFVLNDDEEFTFQLNRHRYWICLGQAYALTGKEQYAECFAKQLQDWVSKEPWDPEKPGPVWRTLEAGLRAVYWIRAMALCAHSRAITPKVIKAFLLGLRMHVDCLRNNPRKAFSFKSNWGIIENIGLYAAAGVLGLPEDLAWAGADLKEALCVQFLDDSMHWEQSPMYHNEVLMSYLEAIRMAEIFGDPLFTQQELEKIRNIAWATAVLQTPAGHQPAVGDSDDTDVRDIVTQAAFLLKDSGLKAMGFERLDHESIWLFGENGIQEYDQLVSACPRSGLHVFADSGQVVFRSEWSEYSDWLYFKNGPLGGGHGHQDKLHIGLWLNGEEVLTDSGRYTYRNTPIRHYLKSALAHNVPVAQETSYARSVDSWAYQDLPQSSPNRVVEKQGHLFIEGLHSGYAQQQSVVSRRILKVSEDIFVICDQWSGAKPLNISQRFHFGENIQLKATDDGIEGSGDRCRFKIYSYAQGKLAEMDIGTAPVSKHYNQIQKTAQLCVRGNDCNVLTTIFVRVCEGDVRIQEETAQNGSSGKALNRQDAEGYRIETGRGNFAVLLLHHDVGNAEDCNGICGIYGLGRTMVCDLNQKPRYMTVMQW